MLPLFQRDLQLLLDPPLVLGVKAISVSWLGGRAGPDPDRLQAEAQRIRSRVDAYGLATTHQLGEARLEFFDRLAQRVVAGGDDFSQPRKDRLRIVELFRQIGERDPHVGYLNSRERCLSLQVSAMLARQAFSMSCRVG